LGSSCEDRAVITTLATKQELNVLQLTKAGDNCGILSPNSVAFMRSGGAQDSCLQSLAATLRASCDRGNNRVSGHNRVGIVRNIDVLCGVLDDFLGAKATK
jgi:hypothetical protein